MTKFLKIESELRKNGLKDIAGVDEAGRGPLAGPLVVAAVIFNEGTKIPNLNDSKKVPEKQRERLFEIIIKKAKDFSIIVIPPSVIDKVNILNAVRYGNIMALNGLKTVSFALFDGNDKQLTTVPHKTIIKGDEKIQSIAAASILAKVTRDKIMTFYAKSYKKYKFEIHKGYGTRVHRQLMEKHGKSDIHRSSFNFKV